MDGKRMQDYWSDEVEALIQTYRQFEKLIPSQNTAGSAHRGEDGRYVEELARVFLERFLPKDLEVLTGFILRPAVKTGESGRERVEETDQQSGQLDLIVYNSSEYPVFQRFGNSVVVPPEGVVAVISVKKHLNDADIKNECSALFEAASLCGTLKSNDRNDKVRGPFLALISIKSHIEKAKTEPLDWVFEQLQQCSESKTDITFDKLVGYIGALDEWSVFKRRPKKNLKAAEYVGFKHGEGESHLGLQFLLTGVLSVFYDSSRNGRRRPGFTAFPSGRAHDKKLGEIPCEQLR